MFRNRIPSGLVAVVLVGAASLTSMSLIGACAADSNGPDNGEPVASVTVLPPSVSMTVAQTQQLAAVLQDAAGNVLSGRTVTWNTSAGAVATVSESGVATAVAVGNATITATSEGQSGTAALTVTAVQVPVASVLVVPASASLTVGETQQLVAVPQDAAGNALSGRTVTWSTSAGAVATVSATGLVTASAAGNATITATCEGHSGTAAITVTAAQAPVASVAVAPATVSLAVGQTVQLTATPRDAANNVLTGRTVTWSTSDGSVATVGTSGLVAAAAAGSATITATSEGQSGTSAVTVSAASGYPEGLVPTGNIIFDTRAGIQAANSDAELGALFQSMSSSITLATGWDGTGRKAARIHVTPTCAEGGGGQFVLFNDLNLSPGEYYLQWRERFGKHPLDANGFGLDNRYNIIDGQSACNDNQVGIKMVYMDALSYSSRWDMHWFNSGVRAQWVGGGDWTSATGIGANWDFNQVGGEEHVLTWYVNFVGPTGTATFYVDGVEKATIHPNFSSWPGMRGIRLHNVWDQIPYEMTEYIWDIVVWQP